jgi:preprotein translocase subunit SecF
MIDFLKYRFICAFFSLVMVGAFLGTFAYKRITTGQAFTYSVEFTGGTQIRLGFDKPARGQQVADILEKSGWARPVIREFGPKEMIVRVQDFSSDITGLGEKLRSAIQQGLGDVNVQLLQIDSIGQGVGEALSWNAIKALILSLIAMLLYIGWRFWSFSYGMGAVIALFHDAFAILFFWLLFNKEISVNVIMAILAVLGYSVNDTIVIFAQIRENIKQMRTVPLEEIVNISINQTLRRTILTSFSTALVVLSLIIFGGEVLRDLSLALLIGIAFGTYSSIYIASPIMLMLYKEK